MFSCRFCSLRVPCIFNVIQNMTATLLQPLLYKLSLILPLAPCQLRATLHVQLTLILLFSLPFQLSSELTSINFFYSFILIFNMFFLKCIVTDEIVVAARIVDEVYRFLKVLRSLENFYLGSLVKGNRIHWGVQKAQLVGIFNWSLIIILMVIVNMWSRLILLLTLNASTPVLLIFPINHAH